MAYELFTDEHLLWRQSIRDFVNKEIVPNVEAWEETETFDPGLFKKLGEMGVDRNPAPAPCRSREEGFSRGKL
jgi:alkylation response protein AidB-like acyl-CoA dehydrogenase